MLNPRLLYIMGRSHSGTTVLDGILGNGEDTVNIGEFISNSYRVNVLCSCGLPFHTCQFWQKVRHVFAEESTDDWESRAGLIKNRAHIKYFIGNWLAREDEPIIQEMRRVNDAFIHAITKVSGKNLVVDSSKEFTYGLFLARFVPYARIIHIVRHPESVAASHLFRIRKGQGYTILRQTFRSKRLTFFLLALCGMGWLVGNLLAELIRLRRPGHVLRIRYEDLCANPRRELERVSQFVENNLDYPIHAIEQEQQMEIGHTIGGNGMRMAGTFVFNPRSDRSSLPWPYKLVIRTICWPLMLFYGYYGGSHSHNSSIQNHPEVHVQGKR